MTPADLNTDSLAKHRLGPDSPPPELPSTGSLDCWAWREPETTTSSWTPNDALPRPAASTTYLVGGMSVEKRSISVSASKTAFMPLELSTCWQNLQHRMDTHRSLKLQMLADMAFRPGGGVRFRKCKQE